MKLDQYIKVYNLAEYSELERIELLAFYYSEIKEQNNFKISELSDQLVEHGFAKANLSRLKAKIQKSRNFVKGPTKGTFRLSANKVKSFQSKLGDFSSSEEIASDGSILPQSLFENIKRNYLLKLAQQINSSYENNLFDGTSLLMRRLLEILIIHSFEHIGEEQKISDNQGAYKNLKSLIQCISADKKLCLSKSAKKTIDEFRELGNLSAHRIHYNCRKDDIRKVRIEYRALIEELLYKAGFIT